jgi:cytochrome c-type biogenesis protein CcmH/NrfF
MYYLVSILPLGLLLVAIALLFFYVARRKMNVKDAASGDQPAKPYNRHHSAHSAT